MYCAHIYTDQRTPVQKFLDDHAKPAGLYMEHLAIDYFSVVPGAGSSPSLVGLSIKPRTKTLDGDTEIPITSSETVVLHLPTPPAIDWLAKLDYTTDSVWSLGTDAAGNSQVYTQKITSDPTTADKTTTIWYISVSDDGTSVLMKNLPVNDGSETYRKALEATY